MDQKLANACAGKSASQGGLNVTDLVQLAKRQGYTGASKRADVVAFLCGTKPAKPVKVVKTTKPAVVWDPALIKACQGKTKCKGGLNTSELKSLANTHGYNGPEDRPSLIEFLCTDVPQPTKNQALKNGKTAHYDPLTIENATMPKLPRGQVGINTKAWNAKKPSGKKQRQALKEKCGDTCFLSPDDLSYPICEKDSKDCEQDCDGLRAVMGLTSLINNRHGVSLEAKSKANKARRDAIKIGVSKCKWERK